ncbi:histidinol-phosphate aminotransferase [Rhizodiscina lignyota]|uniref:histidinol-phosphate transaminase n=1 Tax=Rhizodiscina lignyota TaxID=1504668 RepID=A0A9P4IGC4_9PEZI|nr:histidinol-phosphate aminotransferase [Rhizodiscina lignyota]
MTRKSAFNLETCTRPNILSLQPYRCARDDYQDDGTNILLDANENAYGPGLDLDERGHLKSQNGENGAAEVNADIDLNGLHRYPDPHQEPLKSLLCKLRTTHAHTTKTLTPANLFVGVGSDEAIDALLRCFCVPGHDSILTCPPTYGMYAVSAVVNDVSIKPVPLLVDNNFEPDVATITSTLSSNPSIKMVYLCSPGNPTGALIPKAAVEAILAHPTWNGVVVVDEAYIDFASSPSASLAELVTEYPNLVVMQTLSKAFGLAGIRLGAAFTSPEIARLLNSLKAPYNVSSPTSQLAMAALSPQNLAVSRRKIELLLKQRDRLVQELPKIPGIGRFRGGFEANFLLVEMLSAPKENGGKPSNEVALKVYERLAELRHMVVRFRGKELGCTGCLRVTVGTENEVTKFLAEIKSVLEDIYDEGESKGVRKDEEKKEKDANGVVA